MNDFCRIEFFGESKYNSLNISVLIVFESEKAKDTLSVNSLYVFFVIISNFCHNQIRCNSTFCVSMYSFHTYTSSF